MDYSKFVFLESAEKLMAQLHTVLHYEFESQPDTVLNNNVLTCENPNKEKYQKNLKKKNFVQANAYIKRVSMYYYEVKVLRM